MVMLQPSSQRPMQSLPASRPIRLLVTSPCLSRQSARQMLLPRIQARMPRAGNSKPACRSCSRKRAVNLRCSKARRLTARPRWPSSARRSRAGAMPRWPRTAPCNRLMTRSCNPRARPCRPRAPWAWTPLLGLCPQLLPWPWIPARQLRLSRPMPWPRPPRWLPARLPRKRHRNARSLQTLPLARSRAGPWPLGRMRTCRMPSAQPRPKRCARRWLWSCNVAVPSARKRAAAPRQPPHPHPPPSKEASMAHKPIKPSRRARNLRRQQERKERRLQALALRRS